MSGLCSTSSELNQSLSYDGNIAKPYLSSTIKMSKTEKHSFLALEISLYTKPDRHFEMSGVFLVNNPHPHLAFEK